MLFPKPGVLPQTSQTEAIRRSSLPNRPPRFARPTAKKPTICVGILGLTDGRLECRAGGPLGHYPDAVQDTVAARAAGLELFSAKPRPLAVPRGKADALAKLGIFSLQDLLTHYPRYHVDRTELKTIAQLQSSVRDGVVLDVQVLARVTSISGVTRTRTGKLMVRGVIADESGSVNVTWFNQKWIPKALHPGVEAFFYGRLQRSGRRLQMTAPRFEIVRSGTEPFNVGRIIPVYPATADLSTDAIRKLIWDVLQGVPRIADPLPDDLRVRLGLMPRGDAIRLVHFPDARDDVIQARRRIVFDELFTLQLGLLYRKAKLARTVQGIAHVRPGPASLPEQFLEALPFEPTAAQVRACREVAADMAASAPMHRMIQGEVGSGKTVVALYACLVAVAGGHQAAIMAPTEVLAEQHLLTVDELLDRAFGTAEGRNLFTALSRRPVVRLLTGSTPAAQRSSIAAGVAAGEVDILIGTHALIQEGVDFASLGVAVVDEQHRFGVRQRRSLRDKARTGEPDVLVMTATPIPRTLAVTVYGDLDVSILDELPAGRRPVTTRVVAGEEGRTEAYELIRREVASGRQAFVVYALRDESTALELRSAKSEATRLSEEVFPDVRVGLVHGDMRSDDKERAMGAFRAGETDVLVATTVIEVGVDVPNASVMLIENADRFGLAQLHQLRGRVGRGPHDSVCILVTDMDPAKPESAVALQRLTAVESTNDGFALAEVDLEQRGEGQLFGPRQSGMPQLKMARVVRHRVEIKQARDLASDVLARDPDLAEWGHEALRREMFDRFPPAALDVVQSG